MAPSAFAEPPSFVPDYPDPHDEWDDHPEAAFLTDAIMDNVRDADSLVELKVALLAAFSAMNSYPAQYSEWQQRMQHKAVTSARLMEGIERKTRQIGRTSKAS